jgi:predicted  nucleic acid-binding Zn-ribbon protein
MVLEHLQLLAAITRIDIEIEELQEELGDLPFEVKAMEKEVRTKQQAVDVTQRHIDDILNTRSNARLRAQEIHDKEKKLSEQQYQVRNNREFDAITKEIETLKVELRDIEKTVSGTMLTEENLLRVFNGQSEDLQFAKERLSDLEAELSDLSLGQGDEMNVFLTKRKELLTQLPNNIILSYQHIKEYHNDTTVSVKRNCCSGCFSAIPPQKIVEMRTYKSIFTCESCGRLLYPEEMVHIS